MATHSSVLAWRIPGTGKPGGLPSMGSHRVGHDWSDVAAAAAVCFLCLWVWFCFVTYVHLCYFLFHIICETWILIQHQVESQYRDPVETESFRHFLLYFDEEVLNYTKGIAFLRPSLEKVFQIATWSALKSCLTPVWKVPPPKELFSTNCRVLLCYEASGDEFFSFLIFLFPPIFIFCTIPMFNSVENSGNSGRLYFGVLQNHCRWWLQP